MQVAAVRSANPGPIANGTAALTQARQKLVEARKSLAGATDTKVTGKSLMLVYVQAKQAAGMLTSAAADPRTGHTAAYGTAADLAKRAAVAVGQAIVALRNQPNQPAAHLVDATNRRLKAASEALGKAYSGALIGAAH